MSATTSVTLGQTLTQKRVILKSIAYNFTTRFLPLLAGFLAVPFIMNHLGVERFGVLMLIWSVVGYGTLLDLGLGKGLTQHIAKKIGENDTSQLPSTIISVILYTFLLASLGGISLWFLSEFLVSKLNVSPRYQEETITAFRIMGLSLPFLVGNTVTTGVFEAYQKFSFTSMMNWPIVIANFGAPFLILPFQNTLPAMVLSVLTARIVVFIFALLLIPKVMPSTLQKAKINFSAVKDIFNYSKWLLLNSLFSSSFRELDRFFVAGMLGAHLVAYLTTPAYAIARFSFFINSANIVMFSTYGIEFVQDPQRCRRIYLKMLKTMFLLMLASYGFLALFAEPLLSLWLNPDFAKKAYLCTIFLALAYFMLGLNFITHSFIDATGRSRVTMIINVCVLPFYIGLLYFGIRYIGIEGSAIALFLKESTEFIIKFVTAEKIFRKQLASS